MPDFRIHFLCDPNRDVVERIWFRFLELSNRAGLLPALMYRTANSKKIALKKPVEVLQAGSFKKVFDHEARGDNWPDFFAFSLWAVGSDSDTRYKITFSTGLQYEKIRIFLILTTPVDDEKALAPVFENLKSEFQIGIVAFLFEGFTSNIWAVSEDGEHWTSARDKPHDFGEIEKKTGFNMPRSEKR